MRGGPIMFLNVNYTLPQDGNESMCNTPRTPDILNLLSSPAFEKYLGKTTTLKSDDPVQELKCSLEGVTAGVASTAGDGPMSPKETAVCPPMKSSSCPPPSLAQATSLIAKASLQRTIINRMKTEPREEACDIKIKVEEKLTPEDEARRLKRRERNKVAATKCREKKKEKTKLLIDEAEVLECQNMTLKVEIQQWEEEKHRLKDVLRTHSSTCSWSKSKRFYYSPYPPTPVYTPTQPPTPAESFGCSFNPEVYQDYSQQSFGGFYNSNQFVPEQPTPIRTPDQPAIQFESSHFNIQQIMSNLYNDGMS